MLRKGPLFAGAALAGILLAGGRADANPDVRTKQAKAQAILAQVQALGEEVGAAAERFNGANYRLRRLTQELRQTRRDLARARAQQRVAQDRVAARVVQLYTSDAPGTLEVILGGESLDGVLTVLEARQRVADQDAAIVDEVKAVRKRVAQRTAELSTARSEQQVVVERRAAERAAIEAKLAERQRLLASVRTEIARLRAQERARQAELERRARAALAARGARRQEPPQTATEAVVPSSTPDPDPLTPVAPPADASRGARVVAIALRYLGVPYRWGGASPATGFDCSGFTMYVFAQIGISLPHYAAAQYGMGVPVSRSQLQPGDLVFFRGLGHMGMYIGGGNFIHAPQTGDVVKISSINEPYRVANWVGARRVL